jgi:hypothetical protein
MKTAVYMTNVITKPSPHLLHKRGGRCDETGKSFKLRTSGTP